MNNKERKSKVYKEKEFKKQERNKNEKNQENNNSLQLLRDNNIPRSKINLKIENHNSNSNNNKLLNESLNDSLEDVFAYQKQFLMLNHKNLIKRKKTTDSKKLRYSKKKEFTLNKNLYEFFYFKKSKIFLKTSKYNQRKNI